MPSKKQTKKMNLNPIIISGMVVIALLLIIIAAMGSAFTTSLRTQIVPSTAPSTDPTTERKCDPQRLLVKAKPATGTSQWLGTYPSGPTKTQYWNLARSAAQKNASANCPACAKATPTIDFPPCPTPSPKPTDYVCLENNDYAISCNLATSSDISKYPKDSEDIIKAMSCVKKPRAMQQISRYVWSFTYECTATCLCERSCDVKEGTPVDL